MIDESKLIKAFEGKSAKELAGAPIYALQGVSEGDAAKMKEAFGIDTIREMAALKYYRRACVLLAEGPAASATGKEA
ncbi:MAG: hypothetical protein IKD70_02940 [Eggerthellaceae bacterium]|nr:hypothetical protein [Eggerthellaceae bacterium]